MKISEIIEKMEQLAPCDLALEWDNVGLIIGDDDIEVKKILLSLDADDNTIAKAKKIGANLIITHHPPVFKGIKHINTRTALGRRVIELIKNDITVYVSHTNLDIAEGGVNDSLFNKLCLKNREQLTENLGLIGELAESMSLSEFAKFVADALDAHITRYVGECNTIIKKVAICGGSASETSMFQAALEKGADVYVTGDLRYHESQKARDLGLNLVDATHYATERLILEDVKAYLEQHFNELEIHVFDNEQIFKGAIVS
ncbi:MAG: Nif3-like dinuclear metal center hexameric protein [Defluviitaleaceae bacterium]|nr:Nif3-like dinuclear metal center hexameric protein [Defluviitaleaceae bacterium]